MHRPGLDPTVELDWIPRHKIHQRRQIHRQNRQADDRQWKAVRVGAQPPEEGGRQADLKTSPRCSPSERPLSRDAGTTDKRIEFPSVETRARRIAEPAWLALAPGNDVPVLA